MLQLVYGRAGYGKTEYVFSTIKKLAESGEKDILLITPEQFSFVSEKRLLTELGESRVGCVESTSFTDLARTVFGEYGGEELPTLSSGAKAVKMLEAIETVQDNLTLFGDNRLTASFVQSVLKVYDEMKACRATCDEINAAAESTEREVLSRKLHDTALIISAYDALIEGEYYDPANTLTRLYEKLLELEYFTGRTVFIDGFSGFVAQEYKIIEVILKQAKTVYITFCTDSYNDSNKFDLFHYVNFNIRILKDEAKKAGVKIAPPVDLVKSWRFRNDELKATERNLFRNTKEKQETVPAHLHLYAAKNLSDECDRTAFEISRLLRKGMRARDITVICRDMGTYEKELVASFKKFGVPYFEDERQDIHSQPLMMLVSFLMRVVIYSFRSEDIFALLKTGLTDLTNDEINELENYAFLWNISGSAWKNEFTGSTKGFVEKMDEADTAALARLNALRERVIQPLWRFQSACKDATVLDIAKALYRTITDFSADERLKALAIGLDAQGKSALAAEQGRIWDMLMDILDKLVLVAGSKRVSVKEFYKLFHLMVTSEDLGSIPIGLDNVQLGSADRIRCDNPRAVLLVGANEGEFPRSLISDGIFSESDRIELIKYDFKLYSYGELLNAQERYFAYMAACSASEELYVSYLNGDRNNESIIVSDLKSIFPDLTEETHALEITLDSLESKDNAFALLAASMNENSSFVRSLEAYFETQPEYKDRLEALRRIRDNAEIRINDKNTARALFRSETPLSASRIDDYYNCPFRYFCKFGLYARPRKKAEMNPMQKGTVIHYVLECILKENGSDGLCKMTDDEISATVMLHLEDYLTTKMGDTALFSARFRYQFLRLAKMLNYVVMHLREEFSQSDFSAAAFELEIGNEDEGIPAKTINLPDGSTVQLKGAVDRLDVFEKDGERYVRVVDYKSGNKEFRLNDILYGLNLQMFIYLFTVCESDSDFAGIPSGVLYMHSSRQLLSLDRSSSDSKIKSEENKGFKMKGIVLNDEEHALAKHMEPELRGVYIPAKFVKNKGVLDGNIASLEEMGRLSRKIDSLIAEMATSLRNGEISQSPINGKNHDRTCDFCDYRDVCKNRTEITQREMEDRDNDEVLATIKEEQDEQGEN